MNFYIASGFQNKHLVCSVANELKHAGWHHTYDWTKNERAVNQEQLREIGQAEKKCCKRSGCVFTYIRWRKREPYRVWNGDCTRENDICISCRKPAPNNVLSLARNKYF